MTLSSILESPFDFSLPTNNPGFLVTPPGTHTNLVLIPAWTQESRDLWLWGVASGLGESSFSVAPEGVTHTYLRLQGWGPATRKPRINIQEATVAHVTIWAVFGTAAQTLENSTDLSSPAPRGQTPQRWGKLHSSTIICPAILLTRESQEGQSSQRWLWTESRCSLST